MLILHWYQYLQTFKADRYCIESEIIHWLPSLVTHKDSSEFWEVLEGCICLKCGQIRTRTGSAAKLVGHLWEPDGVISVQEAKGQQRGGGRRSKEPGLIDSMPGLPDHPRHVCTHFYFASVIGLPSSVIPCSHPFHYEQVLALFFYFRLMAVLWYTIFVLSCKMSQIKLPHYPNFLLCF